MASLATIQPKDIVEVDKKGRIFLAEVLDKKPGGVLIMPIKPGITYTEATSREVRKHWRLTKNRR